MITGEKDNSIAGLFFFCFYYHFVYGCEVLNFMQGVGQGISLTFDFPKQYQQLKHQGGHRHMVGNEKIMCKKYVSLDMARDFLDKL